MWPWNREADWEKDWYRVGDRVCFNEKATGFEQVASCRGRVRGLVLDMKHREAIDDWEFREKFWQSGLGRAW